MKKYAVDFWIGPDHNDDPDMSRYSDCVADLRTIATGIMADRCYSFTLAILYERLRDETRPSPWSEPLETWPPTDGAS
jgi:hypothetical protein